MRLRLFLAATLLCSAASATILTFKVTYVPVGVGSPIANGFSVPVEYGDNATTEVNSNFSRAWYYEVGNGWTPNVTADWATRSTSAPFTVVPGKTVGAFYDANWGTNGHSVTVDDPGNYFAELVLTAAAGKQVQLNSFQLRSRSGDRDSKFSINGVETNLIVPGASWYTYSTPVQADSITLRWGFETGTANIALDNVNFDEKDPVVTPPPPPPPPTPDPETATPEPGTMFVAGSVLVGVALCGRRKR